MTGEDIVELFWQRNEQAISESESKYGSYCYNIAYNILRSKEDAEECVNDTFLSAWNGIPPARPSYLSAFLGKIARNLALKKLRGKTAQKRGGTVGVLSLDELIDYIPDEREFDRQLEAKELAMIINDFLISLPETERRVFICRYWYCDPIAEIEKNFGFGQSKVKMILLRTRRKFLTYLEEKGVFI